MVLHRREPVMLGFGPGRPDIKHRINQGDRQCNENRSCPANAPMPFVRVPDSTEEPDDVLVVRGAVSGAGRWVRDWSGRRISPGMAGAIGRSTVWRPPRGAAPRYHRINNRKPLRPSQSLHHAWVVVSDPQSAF